MSTGLQFDAEMSRGLELRAWLEDLKQLGEQGAFHLSLGQYYFLAFAPSS